MDKLQPTDYGVGYYEMKPKVSACRGDRIMQN